MTIPFLLIVPSIFSFIFYTFPALVLLLVYFDRYSNVIHNERQSPSAISIILRKRDFLFDVQFQKMCIYLSVTWILSVGWTALTKSNLIYSRFSLDSHLSITSICDEMLYKDKNDLKVNKTDLNVLG